MLNDMAFCHLQEKLVINIVTKLMDTAIRAQLDAAKTASERVVQKSAEATGDLTGNEIADTTISVFKTNSKEKKNETQEVYIPPEKRQQIVNDLQTCMIQHSVPRLITKKCIEVHDQSGSAEDRCKPSKQISFKTSMLRSDL